MVLRCLSQTNVFLLVFRPDGPFTGSCVSYFHSDISKNVSCFNVLSPSKSVLRVHFLLSLKVTEETILTMHDDSNSLNLYKIEFLCICWVFFSYICRIDQRNNKNFCRFVKQIKKYICRARWKLKKKETLHRIMHRIMHDLSCSLSNL